MSWAYSSVLIIFILTIPSVVMISARVNWQNIQDYNINQYPVVEVALSFVKMSPNCSYLLITDELSAGYNTLAKNLSQSLTYRGVSIFYDGTQEGKRNGTEIMGHLTSVARQVRLHYLCVTVILISDDLMFLESFAEESLKSRLLADTSRLMIIGRLKFREVDVLTDYWVISMLNTIIVVPEPSEEKRWALLTYLPFTPSARSLLRLGNWNPQDGLVLYQPTLFPEKFSNLHGATVNITALPYKPYWMEDVDEDGEVAYSGADRLMLQAMESTLNFSINVLPVDSWAEAVQRVSERKAWTTSVIHGVYPARLEKFDFTRTYEHDINLAFVMVKPVFEPKWQSLYYPLTNETWLLILVSLISVSLVLSSIIKLKQESTQWEKPTSVLVSLEAYSLLLGQGLSSKLPAITSTRPLLLLWLIFAFIIGTIYKTNLVASLVVPRYPPRPETLEELVKVIQRVTMPSFGNTLRDLLRRSDIEALREIGNMMELGYDTDEGLRLTLIHRYPHLGSLRFLQHQIAEQYTEADGTSPLYLGREGLMPILNAWPIPHDAPFKENFDFIILALTEGGIFNKWMQDWNNKAKKIGRERSRQKAQDKREDKTQFTLESTTDPRALTIVHLQGPLMVLVTGLCLATIAFLMEKICLSFLIPTEKQCQTSLINHGQ